MLASYLKIAWKVLLRRKFFTAVSLFAVSFTLAVLLVATAMLDSVFAPGAPETRAGRTLGIYTVTFRGPNEVRGGNPGYAFLDRYARGLPGVERCSFFTEEEEAVSYPGGRKVTSFLKRTDGDYWRILDFEFVEGGPFTVADERNAQAVAVINETTRRRFFGGASALGRRLEIDGQHFTVAGVVRDVPMVRVMAFADVWVPISTSKTSAWKHDLSGHFLALLLARGPDDFPLIKSEYRSRLARAELPDPRTYTSVQGAADTLFEEVARLVFRLDQDGGPDRGAVSARLLTGFLFLLMLLFMLLPALNLINLNLSRILDRSSEIGVRKAFGASSAALAGQFVVENLVLTLIGGALGLGLAAALLASLNASGVIPYARFGLNLRVFADGLAIAVFFGLLSGAYPAWKMSRLLPAAALSGRS